MVDVASSLANSLLPPVGEARRAFGTARVPGIDKDEHLAQLTHRPFNRLLPWIMGRKPPVRGEKQAAGWDPTWTGSLIGAGLGAVAAPYSPLLGAAAGGLAGAGIGAGYAGSTGQSKPIKQPGSGTPDLGVGAPRNASGHWINPPTEPLGGVVADPRDTNAKIPWLVSTSVPAMVRSIPGGAPAAAIGVNVAEDFIRGKGNPIKGHELGVQDAQHAYGTLRDNYGLGGVAVDAVGPGLDMAFTGAVPSPITTLDAAVRNAVKLKGNQITEGLKDVASSNNDSHLFNLNPFKVRTSIAPRGEELQAASNKLTAGLTAANPTNKSFAFDVLPSGRQRLLDLITKKELPGRANWVEFTNYVPEAQRAGYLQKLQQELPTYYNALLRNKQDTEQVYNQ